MLISSVADCYISNYVDYAVNDTFLDKVSLWCKQQCLLYITVVHTVHGLEISFLLFLFNSGKLIRSKRLNLQSFWQHCHFLLS